MSRSTVTQAISASMTLWQITMLAGRFDQATTTALTAIKDNPAQIIIVSSLAMTLGYTLCNTIPYLKKEMGDFPYTNYAAVGAKGGAAIFDTVVHPGEDWLLGTIKWLLTGVRLAASLLVAPVIEGLYYGWDDGFIFGLKKSKKAILYGLKQILASVVDIPILIVMFLLKHGTALFLHIPFRGFTCLLSNSIALLGHCKDIGQSLIHFSNNQFDPLSSFRLSPFYGFNLSNKSNTSSPIIDKTTRTINTILYAPLFMLKDYIILPVTDLTFYLIRLGLDIANKLLKAIAFVTGYLLLGMSLIIDPTIGWICLKVADAVTVSANFIDEQAGQLKRQALSQAQIQRGRLFRWAYANEEKKLQTAKQSCSPICKDPFLLDYLEPGLISQKI